MFSKKATKNYKIFTVDLTLTISKRQIDGENFVIFCGLLRKHELYNLRNYLTPLWLIHKISLVVQSAVFDEGSDNINTSELSCYKI